jgi:hypothetical protein
VGLCNREAIAYLVHEFATVLVCDVGSLRCSDTLVSGVIGGR